MMSANAKSVHLKTSCHHWELTCTDMFRLGSGSTSYLGKVSLTRQLIRDPYFQTTHRSLNKNPLRTNSIWACFKKLGTLVFHLKLNMNLKRKLKRQKSQQHVNFPINPCCLRISSLLMHRHVSLGCICSYWQACTQRVVVLDTTAEGVLYGLRSNTHAHTQYIYTCWALGWWSKNWDIFQDDSLSYSSVLQQYVTLTLDDPP